MPRPLFAFDREAWLTIVEHEPTDDFEAATDDFEAIDVESDEYSAFDLDGQVLVFEEANEEIRARHGLAAGRDVFLLVGTGEFDMPRLMELAEQYVVKLRRRLPPDEPLIALANYDWCFGFSHYRRASLLPWRRRRDEAPYADLGNSGGPYSR